MHLHEEILLLALKDETGKIDWKAGMYQFVMAGAIISELLIDNYLEVSDKKKKLLTAVNTTTHDNPLINEALEKIRSSKKPKNIQHWIMSLGNMKGLKEKTARHLCRQGILKEEESKVLFFFTTKKYPQINSSPERQLIERLNKAIFREDEIDIRTCLLISLTWKSGILAIPFSRKALKQKNARLKEIVNGELVGEATEQAIQAVQAAIAVIAIMPAITASPGAGASSGGC